MNFLLDAMQLATATAAATDIGCTYLKLSILFCLHCCCAASRASNPAVYKLNLAIETQMRRGGCLRAAADTNIHSSHCFQSLWLHYVKICLKVIKSKHDFFCCSSISLLFFVVFIYKSWGWVFLNNMNLMLSGGSCCLFCGVNPLFLFKYILYIFYGCVLLKERHHDTWHL